jgi:hypothetical protein
MREVRDASSDGYGLALAVGFSLLLAVVFGAYFLFVVNARGYLESHKAAHDRAVVPAESQSAPR